MKQQLFRATSFVLATALMLGTLAPVAPAYAGMVGTQDVVAHEQGNLDRAAVLAMLERAEVRDQLLANGVSLADAEARVAAMTDAEARMMAERIDGLPSGASSGWAILGGILVILVITDLMGVTNVFPFINN